MTSWGNGAIIIVANKKGGAHMGSEKMQMEEAAILYYEKKLTQTEIAKVMGLTRQTVSKLLSDAVKEHIVEIKIHNPKTVCEGLSRELSERFGIRRAVVCGG